MLLTKFNTSELAEKAYKKYSKENMVTQYLDEYDRNGKKEKILLIDVNCKGSSTGKIVYDLYSAIRNDGGRSSGNGKTET